MKLTKIFLLGISLLNISLPVKATPIFLAQSSCQASVNNVIGQIKNKGVARVRFRVRQGVANDYNEGNPTDRNDVLDIILGHSRMSGEPYRIENILDSSVLMNAWANEIVKSCGNTAVVSFAPDQSDYIIQYAIQKDGKTRLRQCSEKPYGSVLSWNYEHCY